MGTLQPFQVMVHALTVVALLLMPSLDLTVPRLLHCTQAQIRPCSEHISQDALSSERQTTPQLSRVPHPGKLPLAAVPRRSSGSLSERPEIDCDAREPVVAESYPRPRPHRFWRMVSDDPPRA